MNLRLTFGTLLALLPILLFSQEAPKTIGKQACWSCHTAEQRAVTGTPHEAGKSCEGCHGAGESHVKSGGKPDTIFSYKRASAYEVRERCGQCHNNPAMGKHTAGDVSCLGCHSAHHYVKKKNLLAPQHDPLDHPAQIPKKALNGTGG